MGKKKNDREMERRREGEEKGYIARTFKPQRRWHYKERKRERER
jgi:hypothetical protein